MRSLSQQYQGHDLRDLPTPTFDKRTFSPPTGSLVERYAPLIPHLVETYSVTDVSKRYAEMNAHTSPIRFKITLAQLTKLKDKVSNRLDPTSVKPTSQDILTAYVVSVLNRCSDVPITTITNAASYRHVSEVLASPDVAGNAVYVIPATLPRTPLPMAQTAMAIRRSVQSSRERTFVEEYMAAASALMQEAVNNNRTWFFSPRPGKLTVNSNASIDWRSAHFGYPTTSRFHTSGFSDRYLRVFRSNPEPSMTTALGAEDPSNQSLDVFFSIADTLKEKVGSLIQSELNGHDFPDNIPDA
ncbi:hypothetical protein BN946_scf185032.g3 [Trametes cinnabarina]|uniref:Choline/carnitine acyltransferase domain-containing protein n=1 Tax=Pycnoporus cinnabarinus TaxID=5643 RepID=A0A060SUQ8_PYCCI|nr:hypothetical protein BN946_scf185032.g3 [Trametes cinnabarina]